MKCKTSQLQHSFILLNSFLSCVVVAFLLEPSIFFGFLNSAILAGWIGKALLVALLMGNIFFYSGIYGIWVQMASGEEWLFSFKRFKTHARRYWKWILFIYGVVFLAHSLLFAFAESSLTLNQVKVFLDPLLIFILCWIIIRNRYSKILNCSSGIRFSWKEIFNILVLWGLQVALVVPRDDFGVVGLGRISVFALKYLHFLTVIYIASLICERLQIDRKRFESENEIFLVNPVGGGIIHFLGGFLLGFHAPVFTVIKALTPRHYKIREFHRSIWREHFYQSKKLVGVTCFSSNSPEAYKIAKEFKKRGSSVIMGGPHVTFLPKEALEFCDSVVIGPVESVWAQIVKDFENQSLKPIYFKIPQEDDLNAIQNYLMEAPGSEIRNCLEVVRGCKFRCDFCTIPGLFGGVVYKKPIDQVIQLIERMSKECKTFHFIDNNIYSDPGYSKELFRRLKPLGVKWVASVSIDIAKDDEALQLAKEAGCFSFCIGYEITTASQEKKQGKFALVDQYVALTRKLKAKGFLIKGHFIFGFDKDRFRDLLKMWLFCFRLRPATTVVTVLTAFPGTRLFERVLGENRILNLNWRSYSAQSVVIRHKSLNDVILRVAYPVIFIFFFLTTSISGFVFLVVFCFVGFML